MSMFLFSFAAAEEIDYAKINTISNISVICLNDGYCSNDSYCTINLEDPDGNLVVNNQNMTNLGSVHNYTFNFTSIGTYDVAGFCIDGSDSQEIDFEIHVNYLGKAPAEGFDGRFILLGFFLLLIGLLIFLQYKINFKQWYQSIMRKYDKRNFFRTLMASLGFYFMNNPFSLFYMLGLFVVLLIFDISRVYVIDSAYRVIQIFVVIYLFALFFVLLELLGDIHEFFSRIMEEFKKMGWGIKPNE